MKTGKTSQYLKYAIGEIILVVVGILIALSINNWNQKRKDLEKEQTILTQLKEDYEANMLQLEEKVIMRNNIMNASFDLLGHFDNPKQVNRDSVIYKIQTLINDPTFDPIHNDLISSGNLRLIRNQFLKRMLSNWSSEIIQLQEVELDYKNMRNNIVLPFFIKSGIGRDVGNAAWNTMPIYILDQQKNSQFSTRQIGKSKKAITSNEILNNYELEGILTIAITFNNIANLQSAALKDRMQRILDLIETQLK